MLDPNPAIHRRGIEHLMKHGLEVAFFDADLAQEIWLENKDFIEYMEQYQRGSERALGAPSRFEGPSYEENRPVPYAGLGDLSHSAIQGYLDACHLPFRVPSTKAWMFMKKAGFLVERAGPLVPTLAGLVLFGEDPQVASPNIKIKALRFTGTPSDGTLLENVAQFGRKDITGPLGFMVKDVEKFFKKHVGKVPRIEGIKRVEDYEYPLEVVREAIVNALVHRDYSSAAHVILQIFRDRIIVKSPGHLLRPLTLEQVRSYNVVPVWRNPRIRNAAYHLSLMEEGAFGIRSMPVRLKRYGLRAPDFNYEVGHFVVTLYGREMSPITYRIDPEELARLSPRQREVLNLIWQQGKITSEECTKKFGITRETANQDFRRLIETRLVERRGAGRATYYVLSGI